jgi:mRNA interferase HigB
VHVISQKAIKEAVQEHSEWRASLESWYKVTKSARWNNFVELKEAFSTASQVDDFTVFNIAGNKCRLIALVFYPAKKVFIRYILTHAEYDMGGWKE